jgi:hypothetical protein
VTATALQRDRLQIEQAVKLFLEQPGVQHGCLLHVHLDNQEGWRGNH